jgi:F-type H+-transporting ATPase subunit b
MHFAGIFLTHFYSTFLFISGETGEKKDTLLSVEPGLMIWTILIFIMLVLILKKYAWGPLLKSLSDREQNIKDSIDKAELARKESEKILAQNKELLAKADDEARKVISEGRDMAEKLRNELINKTHEDAARLLQQAKSEIEREKLAALNELRGEITNLAIQAAGKLIDENLDNDKQKKLVEKFINQIPNN